MIENELQYRITKETAEQFALALSNAREDSSASSNVDPLLQKACEDGLRSQLDELRAQLADYEARQSGKYVTIQLWSFEELPGLLVAIRLAHGLSEKEFGERVGLTEQEVQRYEATNYAAASLGRVAEIFRVLDIQVRERVLVPAVSGPLQAASTPLAGASAVHKAPAERTSG